ncbi:hypothetical protein [Halobacterium sp. R2-5]|uniref:hypothetical protein n=1 Tax=Halobacterium sp. R2-5 TaxID=2715751 RepID=UPI00142120C5|nr:hypothetical protein [Halobacterium sp. R2-5]NIB98021.1 hypothetical protein [Halobacterium sp. R2-5]
MSDESAPEPGGDEPEEAGLVSRRWLIRVLVGLGIGVPVAVEASTLLRMVASRLGGDGGAPTTERRTTQQGTGIGDELLPETEPADTLEDAQVRVGDDAWHFEATVRVENTGDAPYTLELGTVTTSDGTRVGGGASSGRVEPGDTRTFTSAWSLPAAENPQSVTVVGITHAEGGDERTERDVRLGHVPVRG